MTKFQIFALSSPAILAAVMWVQGALEGYFDGRDPPSNLSQRGAGTAHSNREHSKHVGSSYSLSGAVHAPEDMER